MIYTFIAVDCVWGDWGNWNQCSGTCGEGTKTRSRAKTPEAGNGGTDCVGSSSDERICSNTITCPGNIKTNYDTCIIGNLYNHGGHGFYIVFFLTLFDFR